MVLDVTYGDELDHFDFPSKMITFSYDKVLETMKEFVTLFLTLNYSLKPPTSRTTSRKQYFFVSLGNDVTYGPKC